MDQPSHTDIGLRRPALGKYFELNTGIKAVVKEETDFSRLDLPRLIVHFARHRFILRLLGIIDLEP